MTEHSLELDELTTLKAQADRLGIKYSANIGLETLRERIAEQLKDTSDQPEQPVEAALDARLNALKLVRVIITPMDATKKDYHGEIFTISNAVLPTIKRFVPFGVETHIENILLDVIQDKQCLQMVDDAKAKIKGMKKKKVIRAYAIQTLPPLTAEQLEELRKSQLARQSIE